MLLLYSVGMVVVEMSLWAVLLFVHVGACHPFFGAYKPLTSIQFMTSKLGPFWTRHQGRKMR